MIMHPQLSIIMPVYNTGENLRESIRSILDQKYRKFELLCIDDCSTDPLTLSILDECESNDDRIQVIHLKDNSGAGNARNKGIDCARGIYIGFLDADDVFDPNMLSEMYDQITRFDADMCVCGNRVFSDSTGEVIDQWIPREVENGGGIDRPFSMNELGVDGLKTYALVPWNRLCHRRLIIDNHLRFSDFFSYEDCFFCDMCTLLAKSIVYANDRNPLLSYRSDNPQQLTSNRDIMSHLRYLCSLWETRRDVADERELQQLQARFIGRVMISLRYHDITEEKKKIFYLAASEYIRNEMPIDHLINVSKKKSLYMWCLKELPYDRYWFADGRDVFEYQIERNWESIETQINKSSYIIVWGNGKKGKALQKELNIHDYTDVIVTDRNNNSIHEENEYGYVECRPDKLPEAATIIATNHSIYEELTSGSAVNVIDLDDWIENR